MDALYLLEGQRETEAITWMNEAAHVARKAMCLRSKCGTVVVKDGVVIGKGYNAPPLDAETNRVCLNEYSEGKRKYDRTCCMHAEWRAIMDALKQHPADIVGSKLYFVRVDQKGNIRKSGKPYCTVCSRMALDAGVGHFLLWHEAGVGEYPTDAYDKLSREYLPAAEAKE